MLEYVVHHEPLLNKDQRVVYQEVLRRLYNNEFGVIFIDATGGTAKTFLINMLIARIREENKISLSFASSGIAATLITGGRTAHSTLQISIDLIHNEAPVCNIKKGSENAKVLQDSQALFWNEITFKRLHFAVRLAFAITINNSQGQSLTVTGLDLTYECFSRGQLYVGMSRAMDQSKLYVVADENGETKSVVYTQVLHSIILMNSMLTYGMLWYFNISRIPYHITGLLFSLHIFKS